MLNFRDTGIFTLGGSTIKDLSPGKYKFTVTTTNFLAQEASFEIQVTRASSPVPMVGIIGDSEQEFMLSRGVKVSAFIDLQSVCDGYMVQYTWLSVDSPTWAAIPDQGIKYKDLALRPPIAAQAEYSYKVRLIADLKDGSGTSQGSASTDVTLKPRGSPVRAFCDGPAGDVILGDDIVLDGSRSFDPDDPFNQIQSFSYEWACQLEDGLPCFSGKSGPKSANGTTVVLDKDSLADNVNKYHIYTLTVSKKEQGPDADSPVVVRSDTTLCMFRPQDASSPIPTGMAQLDCGAIPCPAKINPTQMAALRVTNLKYPLDTSFEWSSPTISDLNSIAWGSTNRNSLFISANSLNGGADYRFVAKLIRGGNEGETVISIKTNAAPFCGAADGECFSITKPDSCQFPSCKVAAACKEFVDDDAGLVYEFYWKSDGVWIVLQRGSQTSFEIEGLPVGSHEIGVRVFDVNSAVVSQSKTFSVEEPSGDFVVGSGELNSASDEMVKAIASGCQTCVLKSAVKAIVLLRYAVRSAQLRRSLLQEAISSDTVRNVSGETTKSVLSQIPDSPDDVDLDSYKATQGVLAGASRDGNLDGRIVEEVLAKVKVGLTAMDYNSVPATVSQAQEVLDIVADGISKHRKGEGSLDTVSFYQLMKENTQLITRLVCLEATAGSGPVMVSSSTTGAAEMVRITCVRDMLENMKGKKFSIGPSEQTSSRRRLMDTSAVPEAIVPEDFHTDCGTSCPEIVTLELEYYDDPAAHLNLTGTPVVEVGATNIEVLSGVLDVRIPDTEICPGGECSVTARIPVDVSSYDLSKSTVCMLIEEGALVGSAAGIQFAGYNGTYAVCNSTKLGEMLVVQYTPAPLPPSPRTPEPSPEPPPTDEPKTKTVSCWGVTCHSTLYYSLNFYKFEA